MTIETKYNIGDEVWRVWYMEIERFKVKGIRICDLKRVFKKSTKSFER